MTIHLNPLAQAEAELDECVRKGEMQTDIVMGILRRTLEAERLMRGDHADCAAENPRGKPALCKCPCHKGHYRHFWKPVNTTPILNPDGVTYHILERCRFCPDMRLKIIKAGFDKEKHTVVSLEYHIRGELRVLSKEEWLERRPEPKTGEFIRKVGL